MYAGTSALSRYQLISVLTAKPCLRSCIRGRRLPDGAVMPASSSSSWNVFQTLLWISRVPVADRKNAGELGRGHCWSRACAYRSSAVTVLGCSGSSRLAPNLPSRMVTIPSVRSTSTRSSLISSPIRIPPLTLIDNAVADGALAHNPVLRDALRASERGHLVGMVSDGGVHSGFGHLHALVELAAELRVRDLVLHCFTDGRDTSPTSGAGYLATLEDWCRRVGVGRVATVVGRYWAMDRDRRWERIQDAYDLLLHGRAEHHSPGGPAAARAAYERGATDEFIRPTTVGEGRIRASDSVLCFNFRPDRIREIVRGLAEPDFGEGTEDLPGWRGRGGCGPIRRLATMTEYQAGWPYPVAFKAAHPATTLGAVIEAAGERQLHVAETEKYAHVTYFFNGGRERPYAGERRALVPSQRDVPTYDHKPKMSAREITGALREAFAKDRRGSRSSTSPTPTWWATPEWSPPRSAGSRPSTVALSGWFRRCTRPGACA